MNPITAADRPKFLAFGKLLTVAAYLSYGLIVLGSLVRATNSGLSCPDWPLCHGQAVPSFDFHIFLEWFHRLVAGSLGVVMISAIVRLVRSPALRRALGLQITAAAILLSIQVVLGGLTVLHLLNPTTVNAHLVNAMLFFTVLVWMAFKAKALARGTSEFAGMRLPRGVRESFTAFTVLIFLQIGLGGMVSSNYAGLACPDFPTCFGQWIPPATFALVVQMLHRGVAFAILGLGFVLTALVSRIELPPQARLATRLVPALVGLQILLGMVNVFFALPVWASVSHLANAVAIFAAMILATLELNLVQAAAPKARRTAMTPWQIEDQPV